MASGVQNQIGIGQAQVLDSGPSHFPLAQQLYRQKLTKEENERRNQLLKQQEEQDLYGIVGDALKLKDFNPVIHDRVRQTQAELAKKIKAGGLSRGDVHLEAQNLAGELTQMSQGFNELDRILAQTKKEYEGDKRINVANIEGIARKMALDDFNKNGRVDPSINYFDEALNKYPEYAKTDKSRHIVIDFKNARKENLSGQFTEINKAGRRDKFDWKAENFPLLYNYQNNGEDKAPTISTRSQPSGIEGKDGQELPMLDDEAYAYIATIPSNVLTLNEIIRDKYGVTNFKSPEAENLRKVEAFDLVERQKPQINKSILKQEAPIKSYNFMYGTNPPIPESQLNSPVERIRNKVRDYKSKGQAFMPAILLEDDEADIALEAIKKTLTAKEAAKATLNDYNVIEGDDGTLRAYDRNTDDFVAFIGKQYEVKEQIGAREKREKQEQINKNKQQSGYTNQQKATYKGKSVTVGVKDGKWYNVQTGEEIK